ncbi:hypothetical protein GCM10010965_08260 [Caldalkalibacillus thermarum]|uniref:hypothetical protein n=1 Tax=Caldalkalibacillus thermarum TaxID=296745 RepID=UPI00166BF3C5|nr:hypothetical protein [Caldalkalibacillus thermarum]GGK17568.1 hypothetical protein GCM10010965_08260 [Caldalkalibacillus thermarum]
MEVKVNLEEIRDFSIQIGSDLIGRAVLSIYLVQFGGLPFTTYIPENWQAEYVQQNGRFGMHVAAAGNGDFRYGEMEIIFFPQQTSRQEAEKHILEDVIQDRPYETLPRDGEQGDVPAWALQSYVYIDPQQSRTGQIHLGEHNDRLFYFHSEFMDEAGDGWGPRQEIILEHWIWQDTGEPLQSK